VRSEDTIRDWCYWVPSCVFAAVNFKGGSAKTPTIVHAAELFARVTGATPLLIDANPASGTAAQRVGLDYHQTITIGGLLKLIEADPKIETVELLREIRPTRNGLRVVSANPFVTPGTRFFYTQWNTVFEVIKKKFAYIFVDMGNDITDIGAQTLLNRWVDFYLMTANVGDRRHPEWSNPDSLPQMAKSEASMRSFGVKPEKLAHALAVFANGRPEELQDYLDKTVITGPPPDREMIRHDGPALVIPHDPYISSHEFNRRGVSLEALHWRTLEAYRQLLITAMYRRYLIEQEST